jgi:transitional endoplasmic reticulum ATPase
MEKYDANRELEEATKILEIAIKYEANGEKDRSQIYYLKAYNAMLKVIEKSEGETRQKRIKQSEAIMNAYRNVKGDVNPVMENKSQNAGEKILEEIGLERPMIPNITFNDVAGLEDVKNEIMAKIIYPMRNKELSEEYNVQFGGGMLLYGPPGTGKTHIVKAIANEVKAMFINVNPSSLYSEWFGKFEKNISALFKAAYELSPSIIFFDEIDTLVPKREGTKTDVVRRGVSQLLTEVGGINAQKGKNIFIIAATNNPWEIDDAILRPGRFDVKIYVPPPDEKGRKKIFQLNLSKVKQIGNIDYDQLSRISNGYSGADIEFVCKKATQNVFMDAVKSGNKRQVSTDDIISVLMQVKPSIDPKIIMRYEEYRS